MLGCPTKIKYKADVPVDIDHLKKQYENIRIKVIKENIRKGMDAHKEYEAMETINKHLGNGF